MDKPVELVPLTCIRCSTPLAAGNDEAAWVCSQCGQGMTLDEAGASAAGASAAGLAPLVVHYAAGIPPDKPGRPFWVSDGQVSMRRATYSGNRDGDAQAFWGAPRRFYLPAFANLQETLLATGTQMLLKPPEIQDGPAVPFLPVTFSAGDARALAEFIVMAVEAGRGDMLKEVQFELKLSPPELWILP